MLLDRFDGKVPVGAVEHLRDGLLRRRHIKNQQPSIGRTRWGAEFERPRFVVDRPAIATVTNRVDLSFLDQAVGGDRHRRQRVAHPIDDLGNKGRSSVDVIPNVFLAHLDHDAFGVSDAFGKPRRIEGVVEVGHGELLKEQRHLSHGKPRERVMDEQGSIRDEFGAGARCLKGPHRPIVDHHPFTRALQLPGLGVDLHRS